MPSSRSKKTFKRALAQYIIDNKLEHKLPQAKVGTYKDVIPQMAKLDKRWNFVTSDNFNTSLYKAHDVFADTLCYLLKNKESLKKEIQEILDEDKESYEYDEEE